MSAGPLDLALVRDRSAEAVATSPARPSAPGQRARPRAALPFGSRRADLAAGILFVACALFLFRLSLFEGWTFVGDPDRINSVLNTRLFEADSLRARGSVSTWSDQQFMGYSPTALHWILPGFTPVPYVLALLPRAEAFHALGILSAVLLALTFGSAYLALGAYSSGPVPRIVGALLYGLGSYTVHKLTQLDLSFAALTIAPLLVFLVRETQRDAAPRSFAWIAVCWAVLATFTVLQEIAYIALLFGSYALYRSIRLRDPWPVVIAGLAFACGVAISLPRVLTVAGEFAQVIRTTHNMQTTPVEGIRFFGDGLLGRTQSENGIVRGTALNLQEGVQLLSSALGALAAVAVGLLARSRAMRLWAIALVLVLSSVLTVWARDFYDAVGRPPYVTRELKIIVMNVVLMGLPLWFLCRWLASRAAGGRAANSSATPDATPAAAIDGPFFLGFSALGLAAIILPEARAVLYYGFLRIDFQHSRVSVAMILPLAALVAIFLSRFVPARLGASAIRWLAGGAIVGLGLWLAREALGEAVVASAGPALDLFRPRRLLTVEAVRVATSLVVLLGATALLVRRSSPAMLSATGGALAIWIALEAIVSAEFRLSGPHMRSQIMPFQSQNDVMAPPGALRPPSPAELAAVKERLETDQYRVVVQQEKAKFPVLVEPHLAAFWDLRLVEGYSTGLPRRLGMLPWFDGVASPHNLDLQLSHAPPWRLLAALNVKYVVVVDHAFWYNPAPGGLHPPLDPQRLVVLENPHPVAPRAFFAARVTPAGSEPLLPGDDGTRPASEDPPIEDLTGHSIAEGIGQERRFSTDGALSVTFDGDRVTARVDPSSEDRFLVLNEMWYPAWQASVDGRPAEVYPTNLVMRGLVIPAGAATVELRYVPFLFSWTGIAVLILALVLTGLVWWGLRSDAVRSSVERIWRGLPAPAVARAGASLGAPRGSRATHG